MASSATAQAVRRPRCDAWYASGSLISRAECRTQGAAAGIVAGGVVAALSQHLVAGLIHGLDGTALSTILAAAAGFGIVALIAAYLPARRIARVDPGSALRTE